MKSPYKGAIHHSRGQAPEGCAARGKRTKQTAPDKGATNPPFKGVLHHSRGQAPEGCAARGKRTKQTAPDKGATTPCMSHNFYI